MTRLDYINVIKDFFGIARTTNDGNITDSIIDDAVNDALDQVAADLQLNPTFTKIARETDQYEYPLPDGVLQVRNVQYLETGNEWQDIDYKLPDRFLDGLDTDETNSSKPRAFTIYSRVGETYRFGTESGIPYGKWEPRSFVTDASTDGSTITLRGANFGVVESGQRIRKGDTVRNLTDDSVGTVHYLDFQTNKVTSSTLTSSTTSTNLAGNGDTYQSNGVVVGDVIRNTSNNAYAFVTAVVDEDNLTYEGIQGDTEFAENDVVHIGTADKIVLQQAGTSAGGLGSGTDNTFAFTDSGNASTLVDLTTITNTKDTLTANTPATFDTDSATTDMMVIVSGDTTLTGKVITITSTVATIDYWIGGAPAGTTATVTFGTGDAFQVESKYRTRELLMIEPASSVTDVGTEKLRLIYIPSVTKPDSDDDPIEIDDRYYSQLRACMVWLIAERSASYSQTELVNFERTYRSRLVLAPVVSSSPTGQVLTVSPLGIQRSGRELSAMAWETGITDLV